jgi:hypothetical protein
MPLIHQHGADIITVVARLRLDDDESHDAEDDQDRNGGKDAHRDEAEHVRFLLKDPGR